MSFSVSLCLRERYIGCGPRPRCVIRVKSSFQLFHIRVHLCGLRMKYIVNPMAY